MSPSLPIFSWILPIGSRIYHPLKMLNNLFIVLGFEGKMGKFITGHSIIFLMYRPWHITYYTVAWYNFLNPRVKSTASIPRNSLYCLHFFSLAAYTDGSLMYFGCKNGTYALKFFTFSALGAESSNMITLALCLQH